MQQHTLQQSDWLRCQQGLKQGLLCCHQHTILLLNPSIPLLCVMQVQVRCSALVEPKKILMMGKRLCCNQCNDSRNTSASLFPVFHLWMGGTHLHENVRWHLQLFIRQLLCFTSSIKTFPRLPHALTYVNDLSRKPIVHWVMHSQHHNLRRLNVKNIPTNVCHK